MTAQRRGVFQVTLLRRLDLEQPDERRVVLLLERDNVDDAEPLVAAGDDLLVRVGEVQRAFRKARERAALPVTEDGGVVFHSLRHTGISRAANHPAIPLVHVRDFARHANLATTQGYVHKIEDAKVTTALGEALTG